MPPDPTSPAERAAAVLRAAEAAAAAAAASHEPPAAVPSPARRGPVAPGATDRLLVAADDLAAGVEDAREQLEALHDALGRLAG